MATHDLILLGQGPSMHDCPFDAETWATLSVLSHEGFEDKPYSKLFCFDNAEFKPDEAQGLKIAQARGLTIVSTGGWPYITERYPIRKITAKWSTFYLMNDMSYMIALALYNGYKSLLLWGVDQGGGKKFYRVARPYVTHWLGVATGMGVRWELAPDSILWSTDD